MTTPTVTDTLALIDAADLDRTYLCDRHAVSEHRIAEIEGRMGFAFPNSFRDFLRLVGQGDFRGVEFFGLFEDDDMTEKFENAYRLTRDLHDAAIIPEDMFAVRNHDGDAYDCLWLSRMENGECPVVHWDVSMSVERQLKAPWIKGTSYAGYFSELVQELIEDTKGV